MDSQKSNIEIRAYLLQDPKNLKVRITQGGYRIDVLRLVQVGIHQKERWVHIGNRRIVQQMMEVPQDSPRRGRKPKHGEGQTGKTYSIYIPPSVAEKLKNAGAGEISAGVIFAATLLPDD